MEIQIYHSRHINNLKLCMKNKEINVSVRVKICLIVKSSVDSETVIILSLNDAQSEQHRSLQFLKIQYFRIKKRSCLKT